MIQVERDPRAILLGSPCNLQAEGPGVGRQGGDQPGKVDDLHAFLVEDPFQIEIGHVQGPSDFAGAIVVHSRTA